MVELNDKRKLQTIAALTATTILFAILALVAWLTAGNGSSSNSNSSPTDVARSNVGVCSSLGCANAANQLLSNMNQKLYPCDNFYEYACQKWTESHNVPSASYYYNQFSLIGSNERQKMEGLLQDSIDRYSSESYERKLKLMYRKCLDDFGNSKNTIPQIQKIFTKLGGWYALSTMNFANYDFDNVVRMLHIDYWTDVLFTFSTRISAQDQRSKLLDIDYGGISMSFSDYLYSPSKNKSIPALRNFIGRVVTMMQQDTGVPINNATRDQVVDDILLMETAIAKTIGGTIPVPGDQKDKSITLKNLTTQLGDDFDFNSFFKELFKEANFHNDTVILLSEKDYLSQVMGFYKTKKFGDDNSKRQLHNYLIWQFVFRYVDKMGVKYMDLYRQYRSEKSRTRSFLSTADECFRQMRIYMPTALSRLYISKVVQPFTKDYISEMVSDLKNAILRRSRKWDWMDDQTKQYTFAKLDNMKLSLGYYNMLGSDMAIDKYYSRFDMHNTYFETIIRWNQWERNLFVGRLIIGVIEKDDWSGINAFDAKAQYYTTGNELLVSIGMAQPQFFNPDWPQALKYGSLGSLIAYRMLGGIDEYGRQYNRMGRYFGNHANYWTNFTRQRYVGKKQCVINAYQNKTIGPFNVYVSGKKQDKNIKMHGATFSPESIKETGGVAIAYEAYQLWKSRHQKNMLLNGFDNNDKVFFLAFAQTNCFTALDFYKYSQTLRGKYQLDTRTNGALSYMPEFQKVFNCSKGTLMNHGDKCTVF
ncbi:hypothetical protein SNEBB_010637 [Seison nebaliae]|nr:hypothetical protein SNEBB_010637 [Seison nebaliae]